MVNFDDYVNENKTEHNENWLNWLIKSGNPKRKSEMQLHTIKNVKNLYGSRHMEKQKAHTVTINLKYLYQHGMTNLNCLM